MWPDDFTGTKTTNYFLEVVYTRVLNVRTISKKKETDRNFRRVSFFLGEARFDKTVYDSLSPPRPSLIRLPQLLIRLRTIARKFVAINNKTRVYSSSRVYDLPKESFIKKTTIIIQAIV